MRKGAEADRPDGRDAKGRTDCGGGDITVAVMETHLRELSRRLIDINHDIVCSVGKMERCTSPLKSY